VLIRRRPSRATVAFAGLLVGLAPSLARAELPTGQVHLDHVGMTMWGIRAVVSGTISHSTTEPLSVDLVAHGDHWKLGPVELRDVTVTARDQGRSIRVCFAGHVEGAEATACQRIPRAPAKLRALHALDVTVQLRGIELERAFAVFGRDHAEGTGILDGELAVHIDESGWSITNGKLVSRGPGTIRITDPRWRERAAAPATGFAVRQRIAATLADFEYTRLVVELAPRGVDPELRVELDGHGGEVAQALDVVVNLRGLRDLSERLSTVANR
jgi:hypothetical protein